MKLTQTLLEWVLTSAFLILAVAAQSKFCGLRLQRDKYIAKNHLNISHYS